MSAREPKPCKSPYAFFVIIYLFATALAFSEKPDSLPVTGAAVVESVTVKDQKASLKAAPLLKEFFAGVGLQKLATDAPASVKKGLSEMGFEIMLEPGPGESDITLTLFVKFPKDDQKVAEWIARRVVEFVKVTLKDTNFEGAKEKLTKELVAGPTERNR